jgi:D-serine deaminase-like pyridoxal phosphate-dependent protein
MANSNDITRRGFFGASLGGLVGLESANLSSVAQRHRPIPLPAPMSVWTMATPALVLDAEIMEVNLQRMAEHTRAAQVGFRPYVTTHKCPVIARRQLELGATGIAVAKISEAEVMAEGGLENILITSPVVTRGKLARLLALVREHPKVQIVVDQRENVRDLNDAAASVGLTLSVFVDFNTGADRTGISIGRDAVNLVAAIERSPALSLAGVQAYAGQLQHLVGWDQRRQQSGQMLIRVMDVVREIRSAGHVVPTITAGGTGTYDIDTEIEGVTEIQAGSYLFMDSYYRSIGGSAGTVFDDFLPSLFVLATAISQPVEGRITIDAGQKAFATDKAPPELRDIQGVKYHWAGDEYGILEFQEPSRNIRIGDKVMMLVPHCDPTVNLYDHLYVMRQEEIAEVWPIAARGNSQ